MPGGGQTEIRPITISHFYLDFPAKFQQKPLHANSWRHTARQRFVAR